MQPEHLDYTVMRLGGDTMGNQKSTHRIVTCVIHTVGGIVVVLKSKKVFNLAKRLFCTLHPVAHDVNSFLIRKHDYSLILSVCTLSRNGVMRDSHCDLETMKGCIETPVSSSIG